jgi:hypothetical protein
MNKTVNTIVIVLGILFVLLAFFYWITPANALPSFMPGYDASLTTVHFKHGLASLIVGLGLLVFVWFRTGKKKRA